MAQCDVQALMDTAKCFSCLPPGIQKALELQLLCELLNKINNIPTPEDLQEVFVGHYGNVAPPIVPPLNRGIAKDLDEPFPEWDWNPDTQTWQ